MSYTPPTLPPMPEERRTRVVSEPRPSARRTSRPRPASRPTRFSRRYDIEWFENGEVLSATRTALALPAFEQAFGAFTHGVLIQTADGPVAVEDLVPGMWLECADGRLTQLLWKGSITLVPGAPSSMDEPDRLYRVMPDAFGLGRPVQDQTFGPHARRINRDPQLRATLGADAALVPLSSMAATRCFKAPKCFNSITLRPTLSTTRQAITQSCLASRQTPTENFGCSFDQPLFRQLRC